MRRRKHDRTECRCPIGFRLIVHEESTVRDIHLNGTIVDICPEGFSIITDYPLIAGTFITIVEPAAGEIPRYGIVRWVSRTGDEYRAGLSHIAS
ncbi:MAG: hypothetical protein ACM34I_13110 [bacterium]